MKAADLRLEELVSFSEGNLSLHGRRLVLHDLHAFAQLRRELVESVGVRQARRILTRYGYAWGAEDAAAMQRLFEWDNLEEWLQAGPRLHTLQGVVRTTVRKLDLDVESGRFTTEFVWRNSGEAEEHLLEFGRSEEPVCWMLAGYASGYASYCIGRPVYFIEEECRALGDRICRVVGRDAESWGEGLEPHLFYFEADDIDGKVRRLTHDLREKMRELRKSRKKLEILERRQRPFFIEVHSDAFRRVLDVADRVAPFNCSVLLTGETGVGKEVMARYIHGQSRRASEPFLAVNCGALPETLLESELFGHRAGSFTGAIENRTGLFEQANGGTILLDEIGDVSQAMQLKILRVLQEREIRRVGESTTRKIDVRIMAATNRNLEEEIRGGRFREDLFYRLRVIEIEIPPLRQRREDILPLTRYFVQIQSKRLGIPRLRLDSTCLDTLQAYGWPGNVRELENAVERAAILSKGGTILPEYLPPHVTHRPSDTCFTPGSLDKPLAEVEQEYITAVLESLDGNRTKAARVLGISPTTLWRRLKAGKGGPAGDP